MMTILVEVIFYSVSGQDKLQSKNIDKMNWTLLDNFTPRRNRHKI